MASQQENQSHEQPIMPKIVDTREPEIIKTRMLELGWNAKALISGDYFFYDHDYKKIGIERKSVDDLLNSIGERLSRQLEMCLDFYDTTILLIEGSWKTVGTKDNMISGRGIERSTWKMIWNYLHQFKRKGMIDELTINEGHTIKRINELYALYQKPYSLSGKSKEFEDDRVLAFPSGCRGKTAKDCLEIFGSIKNICERKVEDFLIVPKVGEKKANLIWNHFNKNCNEIREDRLDKLRSEVNSDEIKQERLL